MRARRRWARSPERFNVGQWWVHKLKRQRKAGGGIGPRKGKVGQPRRFDPEQINRLTQYVDQHPDATLERIHEKLGIHLHIGDHPPHAQGTRLPL